LAKKGLANCLKDENGESRPFAFIAIGGSSNGSTLEGHNYTYVGSQWGKIVDILIETKCMNPIIFIDEIDKVSRTESGKEIISILTHLIDPTQNDTIQDKYFSGVDIDLSKVLFVFSYNDVTQMDRILLDRIHRIKFNHLNLNEKLIICNKYILPELYEKMGQDGSMKFPDSVLIHLIEEYTCESGVRKLKELLYEIIGEVNLEILSNKDIEIPIIISEEDVKDKYLKNRTCLKDKKIHKKSAVGIMNGLWANSLGRGGLIQIESMFIPAPGFLELKLTGMQGDVMKESMQVAKSLAWNLTEITKKEEMLKEFEKVKTCGLHIHCPEGATPKDGPSAGTAITVCLYSLLNGIKIRNDIAITGEINMQGQVTAIGGLDLKILGGMKAGVKTFLFPEENNTDFLKFKEKYDKDNFLDEISFYPISSIEEALKHSLENTN
jgi:ATP-dependent Lon protease